MLGLAAVAVIALLALFGPLFGLWLQALTAGAPVRVLELIGMRIRRTDARQVVLARIQAVHGKLSVPTADLELHYLAGGRPMNVVLALVAARDANIELTWRMATAIDLAGRDVLAEVQEAADIEVQ